MEENKVVVVQEEQTSLLSIDNFDSIVAMAEEAEKMVTMLDKIMKAAIRITNEKDWTLIGGNPYLQETGATKVARLYGVSWKINDGYPVKTIDENGYYTYNYRMTFYRKNDVVEADGGRSSADEFFAGKGRTKSVDLIDERDVKLSAYTNCVNNGIKRLIPGLRNVSVDILKEQGLDVSKIGGYTFKTGSQGGKSVTDAKASGIVCECCGKPITQRVASYSESKFGKKYCMDCQKNPPKDVEDNIVPTNFEQLEEELPF